MHREKFSGFIGVFTRIEAGPLIRFLRFFWLFNFVPVSTGRLGVILHAFFEVGHDFVTADTLTSIKLGDAFI